MLEVQRGAGRCGAVAAVQARGRWQAAGEQLGLGLGSCPAVLFLFGEGTRVWC